MIAWWWVLIAFVVGELAGVVCIHFCTMNEPRKQESKYIR